MSPVIGSMSFCVQAEGVPETGAKEGATEKVMSSRLGRDGVRLGGGVRREECQIEVPETGPRSPRACRCPP